MFKKLHIENSLLEHDNYYYNWHLNDKADKPIIKRIKNERKKHEKSFGL